MPRFLKNQAIILSDVKKLTASRDPRVSNLNQNRVTILHTLFSDLDTKIRDTYR